MANIAQIDRRDVPPGDRVDAGRPTSLLVRWLIVLVWVVVALGAAAAYLAWTPPIYRASTSVLLDPSWGAAPSRIEASSERPIDPSLVESRVRLVSSPSVLARVVEDQHLREDAEFSSPQEPLLSRLRKLVGAELQTSDAPLEQRVLAALAERLDVRGSATTRIIDIEVASRDPAKAARLADAVAAAFVQEQLAAQPQPEIREADRPDLGLRQLEETIRAGERRLEAFKASHPALAGAAGSSGEQQSADPNGAWLRARAALAEARARLEQAERAAQTGRPDILPDSVQSGMLSMLRSQAADAQRRIEGLARVLGPRHPDLIEAQREAQAVQANIRDELRRLVARLRTEVDAARAAETTALQALEAKQRDIANINEARAELRRLERTLETDRATYDRLFAIQSAPPKETAPAPIARQLAPALLPLKPDGPDAEAVLLIAAAIGLALGLVTGIRRERRPRVRAAPPVGTLLLEGPPAHAAATPQRSGEEAAPAAGPAQGRLRYAPREDPPAKPGAALPDHKSEPGRGAEQPSQPAAGASSAAAPASARTEQAYVRRFHLPAVAGRSGAGGAVSDEPAGAEAPEPDPKSASDARAPGTRSQPADLSPSAAEGYVRRFHFGQR